MPADLMTIALWMESALRDLKAALKDGDVEAAGDHALSISEFAQEFMEHSA